MVAMPSPDENWVVIQERFDAYLAPFPKVGRETVSLNLQSPSVPVKRLTMDGAVNPDFSQVEADAGQIDVNLRYVDNDGVTQYQMAQDGLASSRLGFRGVEDLGGGLKAGRWALGFRLSAWGSISSSRRTKCRTETRARPSFMPDFETASSTLPVMLMYSRRLAVLNQRYSV